MMCSNCVEENETVFEVLPEKNYNVCKKCEVFYGKNRNGETFFIDEEVLSGKAFIPSANLSGTSQQFRQVLRKVIDVSPLVPGVNAFAHNITFDANFTLVDSWVSATNSTTFLVITMDYPQVTMDAVNVNITSPGAFDRAFFICEYMQEL